jgi:hypothetical protein
VGVDPFVKLHALEENDNGAMDFVADLLTKLAIEYNLAFDIPHHVRKGAAAPGDAEAGRGASGIKDTGRLVYTLTTMSPEEAERFEIVEHERHAYIRLDPAKVNLVPKSQDTAWFKIINVPLGNGTPEYPNGDSVQTVQVWRPPETWAGLSETQLNAALTEIEEGMKNGQRFSDSPAAVERAAWVVVQRHCTDRAPQQCREIIRTWVKNGVLYKEEYDDPVKRDRRKGLRVNQGKRPGQTTPN